MTLDTHSRGYRGTDYHSLIVALLLALGGGVRVMWGDVEVWWCGYEVLDGKVMYRCLCVCMWGLPVHVCVCVCFAC